MEKQRYEAPAVVEVSEITFETAQSGGIGGGGGGGLISKPRLLTVDFTIPFLPKPDEAGPHS